MPQQRSNNPFSEIDRLQKTRNATAIVPYLQRGQESSVRLAAIRALLSIDPAFAVEAVTPLFREQDEPLKEEILRLAAAENSESGLPLLVAGLSSCDMLVRAAAVRLLAARPEASVFTYLLRASRDEESGVQRLGRRLLAERVRDRPEQIAQLRPESIEGIMSELSFEEVWNFLPRHTAPSVRQEAIKRLAHFQGEHVNNFLVSTCLAAEPPHCFLAMEAIERNPSVPAEDIKSILDWGPPELYLAAFRAFASRVGPEGVETLIENLKHPDAAVRCLAVRGLFRLFGSKMVPVVTPLLDDTNHEVCNAVLDAISDAPAELIENALTVAALRGPAESRRRALNLAAKKGLCTPELMAGYLAFLEEALKDPRPEGKMLDSICDTLEVLKKTRSPYLVVSLVYAGRSASPRLRRVAMAALAEYPPEIRLEAFTYLDQTTDMSMVTKIAFDLAEHNHPAALVPLIRVAMGRKQDDAKKARQYLSKMPELKNIEKICELIRSKHPAVKQYGIDRVKEMGDPRAVAMLLQAIEEGNEEMQRIALARLAELGNVEAQEMQEQSQHGGLDKAKMLASRESIEDLQQQADPRAIDVLLKASMDEDELVQLSAIDALGKFVNEERVARRLIECVGYGGIGVRQKAVEILGKNKVEMAVDALIAALNNIFLRTYAEEALRAIGSRRGHLAIMRRRRREKMFPSRAKLERERRKREEAKKSVARV